MTRSVSTGVTGTVTRTRDALSKSVGDIVTATVTNSLLWRLELRVEIDASVDRVLLCVKFLSESGFERPV